MLLKLLISYAFECCSKNNPIMLKLCLAIAIMLDGKYLQTSISSTNINIFIHIGFITCFYHYYNIKNLPKWLCSELIQIIFIDGDCKWPNKDPKGAFVH